MQNGLILKRNIFQRLKERKISLLGLISNEMCDCVGTRSDFAGAVEGILLDPRYAAFLESSLVLSDDYEKGLLKDLAPYERWCQSIAADIAGKGIADMSEFVVQNDLPVVLKMALNAIFNGTYQKMR